MATTLLAWDHPEMTEGGLDALPKWQRELLASHEKDLISEYCGFPDTGAPWKRDSARKKAVMPYQYYEKGRQFHYWMLVEWDQVPNVRNTHEVDVSENYGFFWRGSNHFFEKMTAAIRDNDFGEAAKFGGAFAHALQDPVTILHSLEAYWGLDWRALDSLLLAEDEKYPDPSNSSVNVLMAVKNPGVPAKVPGYAPQLLGLTTSEAAFRLYQRHIELVLASRKLLIPMFQLQRQGKTDQATALKYKMHQNGAMITADVFYTAFCLAYPDRIPKEQVAALHKFDLSQAYPTDAPASLSRPYRFSPIAHGFSLSRSKQKVPLRLRIGDKGRSKIVEFRTGLGTGIHTRYTIAYEIPPKVYRTFSCTMGLHPELSGDNAHVRLSVKFNGKKYTWGEFKGKDSFGKEVKIDVEKGGFLELCAEGLGGPRTADNTHVVWADMFLQK